MGKHKRRADTRGGAIPYGNCSAGLSKLIADRTVIEGRSKGFNMAGLSRPDQAMRHNPTDGATSAAGAERAARVPKIGPLKFFANLESRVSLSHL